MSAHTEFKVIIVGDSGVGKTSFIVRFSEGRFLNVHDSTVGVDCKKVLVETKGKRAVLHLWDTAGQERFKSIISRFYRSADGAIIMYDVTNQSSFDNVPWWVEDVSRSCPNVPIFLVGNKNDEGRQVEVLEELAHDFAEANQLFLYQSSARDNINVSEVLRDLASVMIMEREKYGDPERSSNSYTALPTSDTENLIALEPASKTTWSCCSSIYPNTQQNLVV